MTVIGEITLLAKIDTSDYKRGVREIDRDTDRASRSLRRAGDNVNTFEKRLQRTAKTVRNLRDGFAGMTGALRFGAILGAGAALLQLAGAAMQATTTLLTIPAALGIVIGAFATVKIAVSGVGDAMKAVAEGDAEKLTEALQKLSPEAQKFVLAMKGIGPSFQSVKKAVQQKFFSGLGKEIKSLSDVILPLLKEGLSGVAESMNGLIKTSAQVAKQPFFKGAIKNNLKGTAEAIETLEGAIKPLARIFATLTKVGMPYIQSLLGMTVGALESAGAFLKTKEGANAIREEIDKGIHAFKQIAGLIGAVSRAILNLFHVSKDGGGSLIVMLTDMINRFNEFATSAEGKKQLQEFFILMNEVVRKSLEVFGKLMGFILDVTVAINGLPAPLRNVITSVAAFGLVMIPVINGVIRFSSGLYLLLAAGRAAFGFLTGAAVRTGVVMAASAIKSGTVSVAQAIRIGAVWTARFAVIIGRAIATASVLVAKAFLAGGAWVRAGIMAQTGMIGSLNKIAVRGRIVSALLSTPIPMVIAVGAALAAIGLVINAINKTKQALGSLRGAMDSYKRATEDTFSRLSELSKTGTPAQQRRANKALRGASGFATGGFTGRGLTDEVAGVVHKGEFVIPKEFVDQNTGLPKTESGKNVNITLNLSGIMSRSKADERDIAKSLVRRLNEELNAKGVQPIGNGAI